MRVLTDLFLARVLLILVAKVNLYNQPQMFSVRFSDVLILASVYTEAPAQFRLQSPFFVK